MTLLQQLHGLATSSVQPASPAGRSPAGRSPNVNINGSLQTGELPAGRWRARGVPAASWQSPRVRHSALRRSTLCGAAALGAALAVLFGEELDVMPGRDPDEDVRPAGIAESFTPRDFGFFPRDCRDRIKTACGWISRKGILSALLVDCGEYEAAIAATAANAAASCSAVSTNGMAFGLKAASAASATALASATGTRMAAAAAAAATAAVGAVSTAPSSVDGDGGGAIGMSLNERSRSPASILSSPRTLPELNALLLQHGTAVGDDLRSGTVARWEPERRLVDNGNPAEMLTPGGVPSRVRGDAGSGEVTGVAGFLLLGEPRLALVEEQLAVGEAQLAVGEERLGLPEAPARGQVLRELVGAATGGGSGYLARHPGTARGTASGLLAAAVASGVCLGLLAEVKVEPPSCSGLLVGNTSRFRLASGEPRSKSVAESTLLSSPPLD
mmetsp:Transcript_85447/g.160944  ORF Transcript_85447/g.160944 Transcript_85447/m.160944 type:complete len:444 (+) Transcript_85447:774-2105(+)